MAKSILEAAKPKTRVTQGVSGNGTAATSADNNPPAVHKPATRAKGVRMDADLMEWAEGFCELMETTFSAATEKLWREKREEAA